MLHPGVGSNFPIVLSGQTSATALDSITIPGNTLMVGDVLRISGWAGSRATSGTPGTLPFRISIGATLGGSSQISTATLTPQTPTGIRFQQESLITSSTTLVSINNGFTNSEPNFAENVASYPTGFTTTLSSTTFADDNVIYAQAAFTDVLQECRLYWWTVEVLTL